VRPPSVVRAVATDLVLAARTTDGGRTFGEPVIAHVVEPGRAGFARVAGVGERRYAIVTTEFPLPVVFGAAAQEGDPLGAPASVRVTGTSDGGRTWARASSFATRTSVPGTTPVLVADGRLRLAALATEPGGTTAITLRTFDQALQPGAPAVVVRGLAAEPSDPALAVDDRGRHRQAAAVPSAGADRQRVVLWREAPGAAGWPELELLGASTRPYGNAFYVRPAATGTRSGVGVLSIAGAPLASDGVSDVVFQRVG